MSAPLCPNCGLESPELSKRPGVCDVCKMESKLAAKEALGDAMQHGADFSVTDVHHHSVHESVDEAGNITRHEVTHSTTYGGFLGFLVTAWRWLRARFGG